MIDRTPQPDLSFQDALRSPLAAYEVMGVSERDDLSITLIKILIDYKCGRLRQAYKRYRIALETSGFDPTRLLIDQSDGLNEDTAQLILFELLFHLANMTRNGAVVTDAYIEVLDVLSPDDHVLQGALYNTLLAISLREGRHGVALQFAELALDEYRAGDAPYLEAFIHIHRAFIHIAQARYDRAREACGEAYRLFASIPQTGGEQAQVQVVQWWIDLDQHNAVPPTSEIAAVQNIMLSGELWGETVLMLAAVLFRSKMLTAPDDLLELHAQLETVIRVRRMTSLLPAMQLLRDEFFALGAPMRTDAAKADLDDFQLLLLQPNMTTMILNVGDGLKNALPRLKVVGHLVQGQDALRKRQFSLAADHLWPAIDLIETHQMHGVLQSAKSTIETFIAECRVRRRFVERARDVRTRLLAPMTLFNAPDDVPKELTATEYLIVRLLPEATSNKAMARQLNVTEATIKFHLGNIYRKLGVKRRRDAIKAAAVKGWIALEPPDQSGT